MRRSAALASSAFILLAPVALATGLQERWPEDLGPVVSRGLGPQGAPHGLGLTLPEARTTREVPAVRRSRSRLRSVPSVRPAQRAQRRVVATEPSGDVSCFSSVVLTPGAPYQGDTTGQGNDFDTVDYPGLGWDELGPDVVHEITINQTSDLRVYVQPDPVTAPDLDVILVDGTGGPCDTGGWFYAGDYAIVAPDLAPGTYYVIVDGYTASDYGPYTLTVAAANGLLLVDDDGSGDASQCSGSCPDVQAYYVEAIRGMTSPPPWTVWDVAALGSPDPVTLNNAKQVVWFCGAAWNDGKTITPADDAALQAYLDLGGRLLLVGQDILWDVAGTADTRLSDGSLFADYLQVSQVYQDVWTSASSSFTVNGVVGNPVSDLLNCNDAVLVFDQVTTGAGAPFTAYTDSLITQFGEPVYYNEYLSGTTSSQKPVGVRYEAGLGIGDYFKTMFLAFAPEADDPANVLADMTYLLEQTLSWLDTDDSTLCGPNLLLSGSFDDSVTGNGNGIPDPGEEFDLVVTVTNQDSVAHTVKLYLGFEDYYVTRYAPLCVNLGSIAGSGGSAQGSFRMRMLSSTPVGYRVRPEVNLVLADSGEAFCQRRGFGIFVGQADVMLVKDEWILPNTTGVDTYASILQTLGYTTAVWDTDLFASPTYDTYYLPNDRMRYYDFVVWLTGYDFLFTLTPTPWEQSAGIDPEAELAAYLDSRYAQQGDPARLILSSQDYLFDRYGAVNGPIPSGDFAYTHLKVSSVIQDHVKDDTATLFGVNGVYAADHMQMGLVNEQVFTNYADRIDVNTDESGTSGVWAYQLDPQLVQAGVINADKTRSSRFVFMPFALENVQDAAPGSFYSKQRFLERLMCQMQMGASDSVPPCGYYPPRDLPALSSLMAEKEGTNGARLSWGAVSFTNTRWDSDLGFYEPISGRYRVRSGSCTSLVTGPLSDLPVAAAVPEPTWLDVGAPPAGGGCYNVIDYEDVFGQAGLLN